jgi:microcystin-dependent protein
MALITSTIQNVDVAKLKHEIESAGNYKVQSITVTSTGVDVVVLTTTGADIPEVEATTLKTSVIDAHQSQQRRRIIVKDAPANADEAANKQFVDSALTDAIDERISELVDGAPEALDTLKELAEALANDADFAGTISTQLSDLSDTTSAIDIRVQAVESDVVTIASSVEQEITDRIAGDITTLTSANTYTDTQTAAIEATLAPVATTGSYNDLTDKPTLSTAAATGSYNDLTDKPTIPANLSDLSDVAVSSPETNQILKYNGTEWVNAQSYFGTGSYNDLLDKPSLATVATTGSYDDLSDKPTLATVATTGSYNDLTDVPVIPSAIPTGMIAPFAGAAAPAGWLLCDGTPVPREDYWDLFLVIGVSYGSGNGSSTFNVPDLCSRVPIGKGKTVNTSLGDNDNIAEESRSLQHSHNTTFSGHYHDMTGAGSTLTTNIGHTHTGSYAVSGSVTVNAYNLAHSHGGSTGNDSPDHTHGVIGSTATDGSHNHLMPTSRGSATNSVSGKVDKNDGDTVSNTGTTDTGTNSSTHSHAISFTSQGANQRHTHTFSTNSTTMAVAGNSLDHSHTTSHNLTVSGQTLSATPVSATGRIGKVTGGLDGNTDQTVSSTNTNGVNYLIVNYIIKT